MRTHIVINDVEELFIQWGQSDLVELHATWEDGEAEHIVEEAYYDVVKDLPHHHLATMIAEVHGYLRRLQGEQEALLRPHRAVKFGPRVRYGPRKAVRCQRRLYEDDDGWAQSWLDYRLRDYGGMPQLPLYKIVRQQPCFLILHMFSGRWRARPTRSVGGAHP